MARIAGFLEIAVFLGMAAIILYIYQKIFGKGIMLGAQWLKEQTPLGAPSRAIDEIITKTTGRDETLGGWLNEILDPNAKKVRAMTAPIQSSPSPYSINPRDRT